MNLHCRPSPALNVFAVIVTGLCFQPGHVAAQEYARATTGTRVLEGANGLQIKVLVEAANLGSSEVELGEITFPPGPAPSRGHSHVAIEIFYILSGQLNHIVNGTSHLLDPGMVGIVRPEDEVIHHVTTDEPVKALVIWAPGGEAGRLAEFFQQRPIGGTGN